MEDAIHTALILAGGLGTRLRSAVADRPKPLAPVAGQPFLSYLLEQLECAGLKRAILCTGHMGEQIEQAFGQQFGKLQLLYSHETTPLGTGGALANAVASLDDAHFLALNGDSYCRFDLPSFQRFHQNRRAAATLLLTAVPDPARFGLVQRDPDGASVQFKEKSNVRPTGPMTINAGVYLLDRRFLQGIPPDQPVSLEKDIFPQWIGRGLFGHRTVGPFIDIGTPEAYAEARIFFAVEKAA
jgi:NDP-sugar pyrophosphorylase family protein